ncbi:hypothetical protein [Dyadobacter tibetensis]|uniref:hypothetical protein n=1 Tax=Dyadobacter tibetensis TaxID=1211851 RepID=UPI00047297F0|nr:hypothetical protein [Dyadobacter tibetensis]
MKTHILQIGDSSQVLGADLNSHISFNKVVQSIDSANASATEAEAALLNPVVEVIKANPEFLQPMTAQQTSQFTTQLDYIYRMLVPGLSPKADTLIAFCPPMQPTVFYGTDAFYELVMDKSFMQLKCQVMEQSESETEDHIKLIYSVILEKLYGFPPLPHAIQTISLLDENTGLFSYYRCNIDNSYVEIAPTGELPHFDIDLLRKEWQERMDPSAILKILPLSNFVFSGFSILSLENITADYAIERLKNMLINKDTSSSESQYEELSDTLSILVGSRKVSFDLLPLMKVNGRPIINQQFIKSSRMYDILLKGDYSEENLEQLAEQYFDNPKMVFMPTIQLTEDSPDYLRNIKAGGILSFTMMPIYCNQALVGVLNVYSSEENLVNERILARLQGALPYAQQLLQKDIMAFNRQLDEVIKDRFTSLQGAVEWKFKEVAWDYLKHEHEPGSKAKKDIEKIVFKDVYPLYGAIDIRNSTVERAVALQADLEVQFQALIDTLTLIRKKAGFGLAQAMIFNTNTFFEKIRLHRSDSDEVQLHHFLDDELHPFLIHFLENDGASLPEDIRAEVLASINQYFAMIDEETGEAFQNRRALELSMGQINSAINQYLDLSRLEIQQTYPIYFEKFRTDGIEYDIYMGQSIAPQKAFNELYLKNIRYWQISSMAAIAKMTHHLGPNIPRQLETTQLIFIHSGSIDIGFRDDERRFDVEGAYNIRYQVIKKRIDKVHVLQTGERLTQPGKIALVYFNEDILKEYLSYISTLQNQNILLDDLEQLELEELQGVYGLRALRVGINFQT